MRENEEYRPFTADERVQAANFLIDVLTEKGLALDGDPEHMMLMPIRVGDFRRLIGTLNDDADHASKPFGTILVTALEQSESRMAPVIISALDMMEDGELADLIDGIRAGFGWTTRQIADPLSDDDLQQLALATGISQNDLDRENAAVVDTVVLRDGAEVPDELLSQDHIIGCRIGHEKAQVLRQSMADRMGVSSTQVFLRSVTGNVNAIPASMAGAKEIVVAKEIVGADPGDETADQADPVAQIRHEDGLELLRRLMNKSPSR